MLRSAMGVTLAAGASGAVMNAGGIPYTISNGGGKTAKAGEYKTDFAGLEYFDVYDSYK